MLPKRNATRKEKNVETPIDCDRLYDSRGMNKNKKINSGFILLDIVRAKRERITVLVFDFLRKFKQLFPDYPSRGYGVC